MAFFILLLELLDNVSLKLLHFQSNKFYEMYNTKINVLEDL